MAMTSGHIRWFDPRLGYGFLICDEQGEDYFVHASDVADGLDLAEGMRVLFVAGSSRDGRPRAKYVRVAD